MVQVTVKRKLPHQSVKGRKQWQRVPGSRFTTLQCACPIWPKTLFTRGAYLGGVVSQPAKAQPESTRRTKFWLASKLQVQEFTMPRTDMSRRPERIDLGVHGVVDIRGGPNTIGSESPEREQFP